MKPTSESKERLHTILKKRTGLKLSGEEVEQAYSALMEFAMALVELVPMLKEYKAVNQARANICSPARLLLAMSNNL